MKGKVNINFFIICLLLSGLTSCSDKKPENKQVDHDSHQSAVKDDPKMERITLTKRDEQYANIHTDTVRIKTMAEYSTLLGTTSFDERKVTVVTSRLRGRLDRLFVRNPQQWVAKGQPLYAIYSEELLADENELLNALQQRPQFSIQAKSNRVPIRNIGYAD